MCYMGKRVVRLAPKHEGISQSRFVGWFPDIDGWIEYESEYKDMRM